MQTMEQQSASARYAKCIEVSKRIRWDIDRDVIRGRKFDVSKKFLPDGLSMAWSLDFLSEGERRLMSQIQGRTYANLFGLVERYIGANILEVSRDHWLGDQVALEALVRFTDEELKHQELFRRVEAMIAPNMPPGYTFAPQRTTSRAPCCRSAPGRCSRSLATSSSSPRRTTARASEPDAELSDLWKDVFLFHWKEESQHAILDELEWQREDAKLTPEQRDRR